MEHKRVADLRNIAEVTAFPPLTLTRAERLRAWAQALEREPSRTLKLFHELEFTPRREWGDMRVDGSPLTVALQDPALHEQGLTSDRLSEALEFFGLSEKETHRLLCSCMHGASMSSRKAARLVRQIADPVSRVMTQSAIIGVACGVPALLFWFG